MRDCHVKDLVLKGPGVKELLGIFSEFYSSASVVSKFGYCHSFQRRTYVNAALTVITFCSCFVHVLLATKHDVFLMPESLLLL